MGCSASETLIKGFSIEVEEANITIAVVDQFDYPVKNAQVEFDLGFRIENAVTDADGIAHAAVPPDTNGLLTVTKGGYRLYEYRFRVVAKSAYDSSVNFPFMVTTAASPNTFINTATVDLTYTKPGFTDETVSVPVTGNIYQGEFKFSFTNTLDIDAGGSGSFSQDLTTFVKVDCGDTEYRILPIIEVT